MLEENKNIKDVTGNSVKDTSLGFSSYGANGLNSDSYNKTNKLITALYMVTDILESEEPLREKLRKLGADIITDIHLAEPDVEKRITAIISLLDIGEAINLISEMNSNILKKEFAQLRQFIIDSKQRLTLSDFFEKNESDNLLNIDQVKEVDSSNNFNKNSIGRIGLQRGDTLMKALKKVEVSDKRFLNNKGTSKNIKSISTVSNTKDNFDVLKKQRREEILSIIKACPSFGADKKVATITDIRNMAKGVLASCGEKTLQRELISMVGDGVLKKSGEKRWSKYSL
ncbi:MAG: hypothetical protein WA101_03425 [Minisyncoccia bacterium]